MQVKSSMHITNSTSLAVPGVGEYETLESSSLADGLVKWHNRFKELIQQFHEIKMPGHTHTHTHVCTPAHTYRTWIEVLVTPLFITAPNWKQPKLPSVSEWINKLRYSYNGYIQQQKGKNYSMLMLTASWMYFRNVVLIKRNQTICRIPFYVVLE